MLKKLLLFTILFFSYNHCYGFGQWFDDSTRNRVSQPVYYRLGNKPAQTHEISVSSKLPGEILDSVNENINTYSKELEELEAYIPHVEQLIENTAKNEGKNADFSNCNGEIKGLKNRKKIVINKISYYENIRTSLTSGFVENQVLKERTEIEAEEKEKNRKARIDGIVQGIKTAINESLKKENLTKTGAFATLTTLGMISSYYGAKLGHKYLESLIGMPTLVRESNILGLKNTLKDFWSHKILGHPELQVKLEEVILNAQLKDLLSEFAIETKKSYLNGLPFRNSLFYGLPGTGKTMFAKRLAMFCDMDYAVLSGADFSQFKDGKAITELHKFFDWADHSKNGLIVFIDEADSFLKNRKNLSNEATNLVNAFLSRTGESSQKIMFVFATNHPEELDSAVLSRIHKKIKFTLPEFKERKQIINLYIKKYIIDDQKEIKRNGKKIINKINMSPEIDNYFISTIAQKMNGLSGRDIEQTISEMQIAAYNRGNGNLTREIVKQVVSRKIEEFNQEKSW